MSCDLLPTDQPGFHYQGDCLNVLDGFMPVRYAGECDPDGTGICQLCQTSADQCPCPGPTQDEMEYKEIAGELFARPLNHQHWDLMICHPPCTYLTCAAEWAYGDGPYHQKVKEGTLVGEARRQARVAAIEFCKTLMNAPIDRIALENPVGVLSKEFREPDQYIQPYEYGDDASKKTCLWLKNLPLLKPSNFATPRLASSNKGKSYLFRWGNQTDSGQNKEPPSADRWKVRSTTWPGWAAAMAEQWGTELATAC